MHGYEKFLSFEDTAKKTDETFMLENRIKKRRVLMIECPVSTRHPSKREDLKSPTLQKGI